MKRCVAMNIKKFFEVLGILYAKKNNVKIKSLTIESIESDREVS